MVVTHSIYINEKNNMFSYMWCCYFMYFNTMLIYWINYIDDTTYITYFFGLFHVTVQVLVLAIKAGIGAFKLNKEWSPQIIIGRIHTIIYLL